MAPAESAKQILQETKGAGEINTGKAAVSGFTLRHPAATLRRPSFCSVTQLLRHPAAPSPSRYATPSHILLRHPAAPSPSCSVTQPLRHPAAPSPSRSVTQPLCDAVPHSAPSPSRSVTQLLRHPAAPSLILLRHPAATLHRPSFCSVTQPLHHPAAARRVPHSALDLTALHSELRMGATALPLGGWRTRVPLVTCVVFNTANTTRHHTHYWGEKGSARLRRRKIPGGKPYTCNRYSLATDKQ